MIREGDRVLTPRGVGIVTRIYCRWHGVFLESGMYVKYTARDLRRLA